MKLTEFKDNIRKEVIELLGRDNMSFRLGFGYLIDFEMELMFSKQRYMHDIYNICTLVAIKNDTNEKAVQNAVTREINRIWNKTDHRSSFISSQRNIPRYPELVHSIAETVYLKHKEEFEQYYSGKML